MNALEIKNLKKVYDDKFEALKGINFNVEQGDFFALLGPNGAGKTTTIGIITSLVIKNSGSVKVFGVDLDLKPREAKKFIGVVPQEFNFSFFEKVFEILVNQAGYYGIRRDIAKKRAEKYLKLLGLWDKKDSDTRTLSGGLKRRLMIARALVHEPKLLILDEPTAGVDIETRRTMWKFIKKINKEGITIILTTHYLEEAEALCQNIAIIDNGKIVENTSMKKLLHKMEREFIVLDLKDEIKKLPIIKKFKLKMIDSTTIEAQISKKNTINELIEELTKKKIQIISMRNKSNRLEELFIGLTGGD